MASNVEKGITKHILDITTTQTPKYASKNGKIKKNSSYQPFTVKWATDGQQFHDNYQEGNSPQIQNGQLCEKSFLFILQKMHKKCELFFEYCVGAQTEATEAQYHEQNHIFY